jgi:hypothetical protein
MPGCRLHRFGAVGLLGWFRHDRPGGPGSRRRSCTASRARRCRSAARAPVDVAGRLLAGSRSVGQQPGRADGGGGPSARDLDRSLASRVRDRAGARASAARLRGALLGTWRAGLPAGPVGRITLGNCRSGCSPRSTLNGDEPRRAGGTVAAVPKAPRNGPEPGRCCVVLRLDAVASAAWPGSSPAAASPGSLDDR